MRLQVKARASQSLSVTAAARTPGTLHGQVHGAVSLADFAPYDGSYTLVPAVEAQTLATQGRRMREDVTVEAIPYYAVDNEARGQTIIIGDE